MDEAIAGKMSDVIGGVKDLLKKSTPKLQTGEFSVNVWVDAESRLREIYGFGDFLELLLVAYKYEFRFSKV